MSNIRRISFACVLLLLGSSCAPNHEPISKEDQQIIAVMMVIGAGIGAGVGAASSSGSSTAGVAIGGALAGAAGGYALGHIIVDHMNQQEKEIRLSEGSKKRDIYVERTRPDVLKISMERGAEFSRGSSELGIQGRHALDDIAKAVRNHGHSTVTIVAYANDAPSSRANRILSEQRARAVADYLREKGVGDQGISATGRGRPVLLPASKTAQKNPYYRRVEIIIQGKAA